MVLKSESIGIEKKFFELCLKVSGEIELDIYDLQYIKGSQTLKVFVQDPETQTALIEDCIKMDRALTPYIDEYEWMPSELLLEVSSPGVFRDLNTHKHFNSVIEKRIEIQLNKKLGEIIETELSKKHKSEKKIFGNLKSVSDESVEVELEDNKIINIDYKNIKKANLSPNFN